MIHTFIRVYKRITVLVQVPNSSTVQDTPPSWALGLKRNGSYYEGIVKDIDGILLLHKQITVTTYGTRTSESFSGQVCLCLGLCVCVHVHQQPCI